MSDEDIVKECDEVADYLFTERPAPHLVRDAFAKLMRHLVERNPQLGMNFVTVQMAPYTKEGGEHFSAENEEYLTQLSKSVHNHEDYQAAFQGIADAKEGEEGKDALESATSAD